MEVTYLYHSGFYVELQTAALLFDYYQGGLPAPPGGKPLYIFASHRHYDHFTPEIFSLNGKTHDTRFVLSRDIRLSDRYLERRGIPPEIKQKITFAPADAAFSCGALTVETLRSTDEGVAFLVTVEGKTIYHAGDLNLWLWEEESDAYNSAMRAAFEAQLQKLRGRHIDLAFLPLDPRQGTQFYLGFDAFLRETDTARAFPMHFGDDTAVAGRLLALPQSAPYRDRVVQISMPGQRFQF